MSDHSLFSQLANTITMALSKADLPNILSQLHGVRRKWYEIGLELKVSRSDLDTIKSQFTSPRDALRDVVASWLDKNPQPTWKVLTCALRSVGEFELTTRLDRRYKHTQTSEVGMIAVREVPCIMVTQGGLIKAGPMYILHEFT